MLRSRTRPGEGFLGGYSGKSNIDTSKGMYLYLGSDTNSYQKNYPSREGMIDYTPGIGTFNPCSHERQDCYPVVNGTIRRFFNYTYYNGYTEGWRISQKLPVIGQSVLDVRSYGLDDKPAGIPANPAKPSDLPWSSMVSELGQSVEGMMQSKTNIIENIVTIGQTARMVKQPLRSVRELVKTVRKSGKLSFSQLSRTASASWMEYRYGWNPIRYSIQAISETWKKVDDHIKYINSMRGKWASIAVTRTYTHKYPSDPDCTLWRSGSSSVNGFQYKLEDLERSTIACVSCDRYIQPEYNLASRTQLMLEYLHVTSLYDAMWELLPCSFVVDWLINVDLLAASLTRFRLARPDVINLGYSVKEIYRYQGVVRPYSGGFFSPAYSSGTPNERCLLTPVVTRSSYIRLQGFPSGCSVAGYFGSGVNITHALDGTALFILAHGH